MLRKINEIINNQMFMLKITWNHSKIFYFLLAGIILVTNTKELILIIAPKYILDSMEYGSSMSDVIAPILAYVALYIGCHCILHVISYHKVGIEAKLKLYLNTQLVSKFLKIDYSFLEQNRYIEMFTRAKMAISGGLNDIETLGMSGAQGISGYYDRLIKLVGSLILMMSVAYVFSHLTPSVLIVVFVGICVNLICSLVSRYATVKIRQMAGPYLTKSRYCNKLFRTFEYGREFRMFQMSDMILSKFMECRQEYINIRNSNKDRVFLSGIIIQIINNLVKAIVLINLIFMLSAGSISVGDFSMIFAAIITFSNAAAALFESLVDMSIVANFIQDYQRCLELEEHAYSESRMLSKGPHTIEIKDVWYRYPNRQEYALQGVSITLNPGEKISIVGFNGAGKSTFVKLLLGLYQPERGGIYIDGINMKEYSLQSVRECMSAIFQDYQIFAISVEENIAMSEEIDGAALAYSIKRSNIWDLVQNLEKKEKTVINGFFEKGDIRLSGGESQRVAMSRSFYRRPDIIALDEPTSALDVLSENDIYENISKRSEGELLLFVSHRLASTRFCHRILVFDSGFIKESGSHYELLNLDGIYAAMWRTQSQKFQKA